MAMTEVQPKTFVQTPEPVAPQGVDGVDAPALRISVCFARPEQISSVALIVPVGTCVDEALKLSGLLPAQETVRAGIFGQRCDLDTVLREGDRIEIYRSLIVEPKAARRRRAIHREKVRNIKKKMPIDDLTV